MYFKNGLPAAERIKHRKLFGRIMTEGKSVWLPPVGVKYVVADYKEDTPLLFAVTSPKRHMRKAYRRIRMKRLVREAFRLNKHPLSDLCRERHITLGLLFIVQTGKPLTFKETEEKIILLLQRLVRIHAKIDKPNLNRDADHI